MKRILSLLVIIFMMLNLTACTDLKESTNPIKSCVLITNNETREKGTFILGCATFSSENQMTTRFYMYIKGKEGYTLRSIDSSNLEIVETNEIEPCIKGDFYVSDPSYISEYEDYTIYVPVGTIEETYSGNIDLSSIKTNN